MSQENQSDKHEQLIHRLLGSRKKAEALAWLRAVHGTDERVIGTRKTNRASIRLVKEIYDVGAVEVIAVHIRKKLRQNGHRAGKLVVKLPSDAKARKRIFDWCRRRGDAIGFSPDPDHGESHLFLLLD
jgi:hypothetical protein